MQYGESESVTPAERTIPVGFQEQPVDHSCPVARPHDGHLAPVHHWVLLHNLRDQVKDERDVVSLALLVVHVPAPLVAVGCQQHGTVLQCQKTLFCPSVKIVAHTFIQAGAFYYFLFLF